MALDIFKMVSKRGRYGIAVAFPMVTYYATLRWLIRDGVSLQAFPQALAVGRLTLVGGCYGLIGALVVREGRPLSGGKCS